MKQDKTLKIIIYIFFMINIFLIILFINNDEVINYTIKHMDSPNYSYLENYSQLRFNKNLNNLNINQFKLVVQSNYKYSKQKNCRYWSYLYYNYFKLKGYDVDYISSIKSKHLLVIAFKENEYYFLDNNIIIKYTLENNK